MRAPGGSPAQWVAIIVSVTALAVAAESVARMAADSALAARLAVNERYVQVNTRKLDAIGVLLTTAPASIAYQKAATELEFLRHQHPEFGDRDGSAPDTP